MFVNGQVACGFGLYDQRHFANALNVRTGKSTLSRLPMRYEPLEPALHPPADIQLYIYGG